MICELCGKDTPYAKTVLIEGTFLKVCEDCTKFGKEVKPEKKEEISFPISQRLERRKMRMRTRNVYDNDVKELALDYPRRISNARNAMGWTQEVLGKKINEKKSVINKLETGDMRPDNKLMVKLEKALKISLTEEIKPVVIKTRKRAVYTLGDLIEIGDEK